MMKKYRLYFIACIALPVFMAHSAPRNAGGPSDGVSEKAGHGERVVFNTTYGELVFRLFPRVAPRHVAQFKKLAQNGAYEGTYFFRIIPRFIIQCTDVRNRSQPLNEAQARANAKLPQEFSKTLRHRLGILSMARRTADENSATSSFSILLGPAPHLDRKYTIFGILENGGSVINKILAAPRRGSRPLKRIVVKKTYILKNAAAYYKKNGRDAVAKIERGISALKNKGAAGRKRNRDQNHLISILTLVIIAICAFAFFSREKIARELMLSLMLVIALIAGFILFILLTPEGHKHAWIAVLVYVGLFGLFRLMSRFENTTG